MGIPDNYDMWLMHDTELEKRQRQEEEKENDDETE
jgi:hypothetical protein